MCLSRGLLRCVLLMALKGALTTWRKINTETSIIPLSKVYLLTLESTHQLLKRPCISNLASREFPHPHTNQCDHTRILSGSTVPMSVRYELRLVGVIKVQKHKMKTIAECLNSTIPFQMRSARTTYTNQMLYYRPMTWGALGKDLNPFL